MWQRVQTVFLVLTVFCLVSGTLLPFPIWEGQSTDGIRYALYPIYFLTESGGEKTNAYMPFCATAVLIAAAATLAIMEMRRYDDRILQIKLGTLNTLLLAGAMICAVAFTSRVMDAHPEVAGKYDGGLYFIFGAVTFNWLAVRFIRRDEKKVRDSNRIR